MQISYNKKNKRDQKLWGALLDFLKIVEEWTNQEFVYTDILKWRWIDHRTFERNLWFIRKKNASWKITIHISNYISVIKYAVSLRDYIQKLDDKSAKIFQLVMKSINQ